MAASIVDPRMLAELRNFWRSRCSIYQVVITRNSIGEDVRTPVLFTGHEQIPCNFAEMQGRMADFTEQRTPDSTFVRSLLEAQLDAYYPLIAEDMQAVIDGVTYDIRGVTQSSVQSHTKLSLELVK